MRVIRKLKFLFKKSLYVLILIFIFTFFNTWLGLICIIKNGGLTAEEKKYELMIQEDEARIEAFKYEGDKGINTSNHSQKVAELLKTKEINVFASNLLPYVRNFSDVRNPDCISVIYDAELPSASIVIIFRNEPYSVLVRTVQSLLASLNRSHPVYDNAPVIDEETGEAKKLGYPGQTSQYLYLKEIILVDDASTDKDLKGKLDYYIKSRVTPGIVKIIRILKQSGIVNSRLAGAREATGEVLVFLDAHCEPIRDWLRPLLQRLKEKPDVVVMPIIMPIHGHNFTLEPHSPGCFQIGTFYFSGHYADAMIPPREIKRRKYFIAPTLTPTMMGGLLAINRQYFWDMGSYDDQMRGWGGENLEMSFRMWMCGSSLEIIPCSVVGHVFRPHKVRFKYEINPEEEFIRNSARMAEVWMDDYKALFYESIDHEKWAFQKIPAQKIGDLEDRKQLREKLKCKSFQWYLDNVQQDEFVPFRDSIAYGRFRNINSNTCLQVVIVGCDKLTKKLTVNECRSSLTKTQAFGLTVRGFIKWEVGCAILDDSLGTYADIKDTSAKDEGYRLFIPDRKCGDIRETWRLLPSNQLQHNGTGFCLDSRLGAGEDAVVRPCSDDEPTQKWELEYTDEHNCNSFNKLTGPELQRVEAYRRICKFYHNSTYKQQKKENWRWRWTINNFMLFLENEKRFVKVL